MSDAGERRDGRVLILAPTGRDAEIASKYLVGAGLATEVCAGIVELCERIEEGGGAALVAEEALGSEGAPRLLGALARQPEWSDFPLVILAAGGGGDARKLKGLVEAANVTLVERPTRVITVISAVRSALRARRRQYEARAHIEAERRAQEERTRLLEEAVAAREQAEQATAQAEEANRAKDIFLATLSHELRTPLTAVLGWARMLHEMNLDEETARHGLKIIERNAEAQNQLVRDLLDVSRIITGKLRLETTSVELAPVVESALDSVRQAAEAKDISLGFESGAGPEVVSGDPDRLQQVVWNLLSNAIKFTPKGGRVGVTLGREGSDVLVRVSDTGQGISQEFLPYVFERFRQADGSTTREHGGLGLGLAVVRHLVEQHGGRVAAESGGEGHGSTFTITLPVAAVRVAASRGTGSGPLREAGGKRPAASPAVGKPLSGVRVLVVDDQPDARELLALVLERAGAAVRTAATADAAVNLLRAEPADVLVSDIGMPGEDGYKLVGRVRALPASEGGRVPAVALTAYATEEDRRRALDAGFEEHVSKPVEPSALVAAVAALAARGRGEGA
ncbi:MAG TPA: ATP-binding protein [Pyrinomonadaceae bacterium]|nr:ATP-binding protein [Pyrinomonadaceae bacterium]